MLKARVRQAGFKTGFDGVQPLCVPDEHVEVCEAISAVNRISFGMACAVAIDAEQFADRVHCEVKSVCQFIGKPTLLRL